MLCLHSYMGPYASAHGLALVDVLIEFLGQGVWKFLIIGLILLSACWIWLATPLKCIFIVFTLYWRFKYDEPVEVIVDFGFICDAFFSGVMW